MSEQKQRIIQLTAENIKRIKAVTLSINDGVTVIGGRNAQGKSSLLDCFMFLFLGKRHPDPKLLRAGEEKGFVEAETEELILKRTITETGGGSLTIRTKLKGGAFNSPQSVIDRMTSRMCFDPLAFQRLEPAKQAEMLRSLVGIDTEKWDKESKQIYDQRSEINREFKAFEAEVAGMAVDESAVEMKDPEPVREALRGIQDQNRDLRTARGEQSAEWHTLSGLVNTERTLFKRIKTLKAELESLEAQYSSIKSKIESQESLHNEARFRADNLEGVIPDQSDLLAQLDEINMHNQNVARFQHRAELAAERDEKRRMSANLTRTLEQIDREKKAALAAVKMPIEGLSFTNAGVLLNDHPFEQASGAEQLKTSVAISAAMNPDLPFMIVKDGSLLDNENMRILIEMAKEKDLQILVERVEKDEFVTIVIEDGTVQGSPDAGNSPSGQRTLSI